MASVGLVLPPFIRFAPTDEELTAGFLSQKLGGGDGESWGDWSWAAFSDLFIPTVDLYEDYAYPWQVCQELAYPYGAGSTEFYCFTPRRNKYGGGFRPDRSVGSGTWSSNGGDTPIYHREVLVGHKVNLTFKMMLPPGTGVGSQGTTKKPEMVNTHWVMHEYRLERSGFQEMVLCRVRNQKKERDEAKHLWRTPWWEQQQAFVGGGGNCSCSKKRKVAPLCVDDAVVLSPRQQCRRQLGLPASSKFQKLEVATPPQQAQPVIRMGDADSSEVQRQQQADVFPAPPAVSSSAAASPFYSTCTAVSSNDDDQGFWPLPGGFGAEHDELLQEALDYYTEEAASVNDSRTALPLQQQQQRNDELCSNVATPLAAGPVILITDAPNNDNLHAGDSERESINSGSTDVAGMKVAAPPDLEPAAAGSTAGTLSFLSAGASANGDGWSFDQMELLYWRDMAFDAHDPCWRQVLPSCCWVDGGQQVVEEGGEEAEFRLWDW